MESQNKKDGKPSLPNKERIRKYGAYSIMILAFCGCCFWIASPYINGKDKTETGGLNLEIPDGIGENIEGSKLRAIDKVNASDKGRKSGLSLSDNRYFKDIDSINSSEPNSMHTQNNSISNTTEAYTRLNSQIGSFHNQSSLNPEIEKLKAEVREANHRAEQAQQRIEKDPAEILEKSLELAAKYMNINNPESPNIKEHTIEKPDKSTVTVVRAHRNSISRLPQQIDEADFIEALNNQRNMGFNTAVGNPTASNPNSLSVCIDGDQIVTNGFPVKIRTREALNIDGNFLPAGSVLSGICRVNNTRLFIDIGTIQYSGNIFHVELSAHDKDGNKGLYIPGSGERDALKDGAASMSSTIGSGISFVNSAGQQVAMDLTRGAMAGTSKYISSKLREIKINLKSGYEFYLISSK